MTHSLVEVDSEVEEGVAEADEVEVVSWPISLTITMVPLTVTLTSIAFARRKIRLEALCGEDEAALVEVEEGFEEEGL